MTSRTAYAFADVNRVIEIRKIRQVVNTHPFQRLSGSKTRAHRFEIGTVGPNLFVTTHAHSRRRHARGRRRLDRSVAITAIDAVIADMMLVTELNGLLPLDVLAGVPA